MNIPRRFWFTILTLAALAPSTALSQDTDRCVPGGGGLVVSGDGQTTQREFPLKHTDVDVDISGFVARVVVTQTFQNPFEDTIEATYVFPLPHEAAVTDLVMRLGERTVVGTIERRDEARRIYEAARNSGHVAALLEQERPNIFTQSVANILPGNEVEVRITYVEALAYEAGEYELAFPMVVGPRFIPPGAPAGDMLVPAGGFAPVPAPGVPDADRITPPYLQPSIRSGHDVSLRVKLDAGVPVRDVRSTTHAVHVDRDGAKRATVRLSELDDIPNRDFVLRYRVDGDGPETGVLAYHDGESGYVTVVVQPKIDLSGSEITPKEMVFVLDCSGSMSGEPIAAAKALVRHALREMRPSDTFQILRFSSNASGLAPAPLACTPENVRRGLAYIDALQGGGGTMMIEGVKAALDAPADPNRLRIVMFLTDGYIGNDDQVLTEVHRRIGGARLFSFGVGGSVNRYLLDRMAEEGRGEVAYVLPGTDATNEVEKFYARVRNPYLTDVELAWNGVRVDDTLPARIPDLFEGKPLVVNARYASGGRGTLEVRGKLAGRVWKETVRVDLPRSESGNAAVGTLWARARIADLERASVRGGGVGTGVEEEITRIGLAHRLVTKYTSFVAVEESMVVSNGVPTLVRVPLEMPEGVSFEGVFGRSADEAKMMSAAPPVATSHLQALGYLGGPSGGPSGGSSGGSFDGRAGREAANAPEPAPSSDRDPVRFRQEREVDTALVVRVEAAQREVAAGEAVVLRVTFTNGEGRAVSVPDEAAAQRGDVRFRILDAAWRETFVGLEKAGSTRSLAPGESVTYEIRLDPARAAALRQPGTVHVILHGASFGGGDSNRVTVRIRGR